MRWLTTIIPSLLTSAVVSGLVAGLFNQLSLRTQYKNAYFKIVLDSRVQAYVLLSTLLGQCSSLVRGDDNLVFYFPFINEAALDGFNEIRHRVDAERLWFSDAALSALHELDVLMINVPDDPSAIMQFGKDNAGRFTDIVSNLRNAHAADMLRLHDIAAFLKCKIREGQAPREVEASEITREVITASDADQAIHQDELGDSAMEAGDLEVAKAHYRNALAIRERLSTTDSENAEWRHDLAVSNLHLGDVTFKSRHLGEARYFYSTAHDTLRRLVADDSASAWERSLAVVCSRLGDLAAENDLAEARGRQNEALAIRLRLVAAAPDDSEALRDLSTSHERLGGLALDAGDLEEATMHYREALVIAERLVVRDAADLGLQRDLAISYAKIGDVAEKLGNLPEAISKYEAGLRITERLATNWPDETLYANDLSFLNSRLDDLRGQSTKASEDL